jgi:hypothetical protein
VQGREEPGDGGGGERARPRQVDPLEVLRIDLAVTDREGRVMLAKELVALADLWPAHQDEFREYLASEEVLTALAKMSM